MKIMLINISPHELRVIGYGVRILSSCMKREGHDVETVFLHNYVGKRYEEQTLNDLVELAAGSDLIGISLMTDNFENAVLINKKLKDKLDIPIVWGGIHPTIRPAECLKYADMVCIGEGEDSLVELVRKMERGEDTHTVAGMWFKDNGRIIKNSLRPLVEDLDSIPFQDFDYETHYMLWGREIRKMNEEMLKLSVGREYLTLSSRGCPFACTYCWNHAFHRLYPNQKMIRRRSVDNVIKELVLIIGRFPFIQLFCIDDDAFFMRSKSEIADFAGKYQEQVGVPLWITGASPLTVTREKLALLTEGGMTSLRMGIQTGSERIKRLYGRNYSNRRVLRVVRMINDYKDKIELPGYDIILDNPWETEADVITTLRFLARFPTPYVLLLFPLILYPGTELYEKEKREKVMGHSPEETWRRRHHEFENTYLNNLFFLLSEYGQNNMRISVPVMFLLTSRPLRRWHLSELLFQILKKRVQGSLLERVKYLLREGMKDIARGDGSRISSYLKNRTGIFDN